MTSQMPTQIKNSQTNNNKKKRNVLKEAAKPERNKHDNECAKLFLCVQRDKSCSHSDICKHQRIVRDF